MSDTQSFNAGFPSPAPPETREHCGPMRPTACGAFAPHEHGNGVVELLALPDRIVAEADAALFTHREFLAALRARFPGARLASQETDSHRRCAVFVDGDPTAHIRPEEAALWDTLYGSLCIAPTLPDESSIDSLRPGDYIYVGNQLCEVVDVLPGDPPVITVREAPYHPDDRFTLTEKGRAVLAALSDARSQEGASG